MLHSIQKFNVHFHIEFIVANVVERINGGRKNNENRIRKYHKENKKLVNFVVNFLANWDEPLRTQPERLDVFLSRTVNHLKLNTTKIQTSLEARTHLERSSSSFSLAGAV